MLTSLQHNSEMHAREKQMKIYHLNKTYDLLTLLW